MSQDIRPSGEPSPGDMDHFNHEVHSELLSMKELQSRLGLCLEQQERIHQRLDAFCTGINELVEQVNTHSEAWTGLKPLLEARGEQLVAIVELIKANESAMGKAHKRIWERIRAWDDRFEEAILSLNRRVEELENDQEIVRRANNV